MKKLVAVSSLLLCVSACFGAGLTVSTTNGFASGLTLDGTITNRGLISGGSFDGSLSPVGVSNAINSASIRTKGGLGTLSASNSITSNNLSGPLNASQIAGSITASTQSTNGPDGKSIATLNETLNPPVTGTNDVSGISHTNLPAWLQNQDPAVYASAVTWALATNEQVLIGWGGDSMSDDGSGSSSSLQSSMFQELVNRYGYCGDYFLPENFLSSPNGGEVNPFFQSIPGTVVLFSGDTACYLYSGAPGNGTNVTAAYISAGDIVKPYQFGGGHGPDAIGERLASRDTYALTYLSYTNAGTLVVSFSNQFSAGVFTNFYINAQSARAGTNGLWLTTNVLIAPGISGTPSKMPGDLISVYSKTNGAGQTGATNIVRGLSAYSTTHRGVVRMDDAAGGTYPQQRTFDPDTLKGQGVRALTAMYSNAYAAFNNQGAYIEATKHLQSRNQSDLQNSLDEVTNLLCLPSNIVTVVVGMPQRYNDNFGYDARTRYWFPWIVANLQSNAHRAVYLDLFKECSDTNLYEVANNDWDGIHQTTFGNRALGHIALEKLGWTIAPRLPQPDTVEEKPDSPPTLWWPLTESVGRWDERMKGLVASQDPTTDVWTNDGTGIALSSVGGGGNNRIYNVPLDASNLCVNESGSFVMWIKWYTNNNGISLFTVRGTKGGSTVTPILFYVQNQVTFQKLQTDRGTGNNMFWSNGTWHQIGFGYDASTRHFDYYVDGKVDKESSWIGNASWAGVSNNLVYVLGDAFGQGQNGPACFSDLRLYRHYLGAAELAKLYASSSRASVSYVDQTINGNLTANTIQSASGFTFNGDGRGTTNQMTTNIVATAAGDSSRAGFLGEFTNKLVASGSAQALSTGTPTNVTSILLGAGDWDVMGAVHFALTGATTTSFKAGIGTTSATIPSDGSEAYSAVVTTALTDTETVTVSRVRVNVSSSTTVYLVGQSAFSVGSESVFGTLSARRAR